MYKTVFMALKSSAMPSWPTNHAAIRAKLYL